MSKVIAEIATDPIGTNCPNESDYIVAAERVLKQAVGNGMNVQYKINPMSTTLEGEARDVFSILEQMHAAPFREGAVRVITSIRIDERRDRQASMAHNVDVVEKKLAVSKANMC